MKTPEFTLEYINPVQFSTSASGLILEVQYKLTYNPALQTNPYALHKAGTGVAVLKWKNMKVNPVVGMRLIVAIEKGV